jgi:hypothetical protein
MAKLLLMSVLIMTVVIPMVTATDRSARRGFKRTILWMVAFNAFYLVAIIYVYPRLPQ